MLFSNIIKNNTVFITILSRSVSFFFFFKKRIFRQQANKPIDHINLYLYTTQQSTGGNNKSKLMTN